MVYGGEVGGPVPAGRRDVVEQSVMVDGVEDGECSRARHRVATERGPVITPLQRLGRSASGTPRTPRQPASEALCQRDDVGAHVLVLMGEPSASAADAPLHLVE